MDLGLLLLSLEGGRVCTAGVDSNVCRLVSLWALGGASFWADAISGFS